MVNNTYITKLSTETYLENYFVLIVSAAGAGGLILFCCCIVVSCLWYFNLKLISSKIFLFV